MDDESKSAVKLLDALGQIHERLIRLAADVRKHTSVFQASQAIDVRGLLSGTFMDAWVSAQLVDGFTLDWYLEITWDADGWLVEASVCTNDDEKSRFKRTFPERRT